MTSLGARAKQCVLRANITTHTHIHTHTSIHKTESRTHRSGYVLVRFKRPSVGACVEEQLFRAFSLGLEASADLEACLFGLLPAVLCQRDLGVWGEGVGGLQQRSRITKE